MNAEILESDGGIVQQPSASVASSSSSTGILPSGEATVEAQPSVTTAASASQTTTDDKDDDEKKKNNSNRKQNNSNDEMLVESKLERRLRKTGKRARRKKKGTSSSLEASSRSTSTRSATRSVLSMSSEADSAIEDSTKSYSTRSRRTAYSELLSSDDDGGRNGYAVDTGGENNDGTEGDRLGSSLRRSKPKRRRVKKGQRTADVEDLSAKSSKPKRKKKLKKKKEPIEVEASTSPVASTENEKTDSNGVSEGGNGTPKTEKAQSPNSELMVIAQNASDGVEPPPDLVNEQTNRDSEMKSAIEYYRGQQEPPSPARSRRDLLANSAHSRNSRNSISSRMLRRKSSTTLGSNSSHGGRRSHMETFYQKEMERLRRESPSVQSVGSTTLQEALRRESIAVGLNSDRIPTQIGGDMTKPDTDVATLLEEGEDGDESHGQHGVENGVGNENADNLDEGTPSPSMPQGEKSFFDREMEKWRREEIESGLSPAPPRTILQKPRALPHRMTPPLPTTVPKTIPKNRPRSFYQEETDRLRNEKLGIGISSPPPPPPSADYPNDQHHLSQQQPLPPEQQQQQQQASFPPLHQHRSLYEDESELWRREKYGWTDVPQPTNGPASIPQHGQADQPLNGHALFSSSPYRPNSFPVGAYEQQHSQLMAPPQPLPQPPPIQQPQQLQHNLGNVPIHASERNMSSPLYPPTLAMASAGHPSMNSGRNSVDFSMNDPNVGQNQSFRQMMSPYGVALPNTGQFGSQRFQHIPTPTDLHQHQQGQQPQAPFTGTGSPAIEMIAQPYRDSSRRFGATPSPTPRPFASNHSGPSQKRIASYPNSTTGLPTNSGLSSRSLGGRANSQRRGETPNNGRDSLEPLQPVRSSLKSGNVSSGPRPGAYMSNMRASGGAPAWVLRRSQQAREQQMSSLYQPSNSIVSQDQSNIPPELRVDPNILNNLMMMTTATTGGGGEGGSADDDNTRGGGGGGGEAGGVGDEQDPLTVPNPMDDQNPGQVIVADCRASSRRRLSNEFLDPETGKKFLFARIRRLALIACICILALALTVVIALGIRRNQIANPSPPLAGGQSDEGSADDGDAVPGCDLMEIDEICAESGDPTFVLDERCESLNYDMVKNLLELDDDATASRRGLHDRFALSMIYFLLGGRDWTVKVRWLSTDSVCTWIGVGCDQNDSVIDLNLERNGLSGRFPSEMGLLSNLQRLRLNSNQALRGTLPSNLASLRALRFVDLDESRLSGALPTEIFDLPMLDTLSISGNRLVGTIPTEIGLATSITNFSLLRNSFGSTIPSELGLCRKLEILAIGENSLIGSIPTTIGRLTKLTRLTTQRNALQGQIPTELGFLTSLVSIDLSSNQLSGTIPTEFGLMTNMKDTNLLSNRLGGSIPFTLGLLTNLETLFLNANLLTGTISSELGALTLLSTFTFSSNNLQGPIPMEVCDLRDGELFTLGGDSEACTNDFYGGAYCPTVNCCPDCPVLDPS